MAITLSEQIGFRLRAARKAAGYKSAADFVIKNNIPQSTYSQYETGKRTLDAEKIVHFSKYLGIEPGWLLTGLGSPYEFNHKDQEEIINLEMGKLGQKPTLPKKASIIKGARFAQVDIHLLTFILKELAPVFSDPQVSIDYEDLISFCFDIYNNVITTS